MVTRVCLYCVSCLSPDVGLCPFLQEKYQTSKCSCDGINLNCKLSYKHPAFVSSDIQADPSSPLNSWASSEPWVGCHCNYIVTQRKRANKICKRERGRENPHEREGWRKGSGANCAHDSIRAVQREPASKQGFLFLCCACASFRKGEGAVENAFSVHCHETH